MKRKVVSRDPGSIPQLTKDLHDRQRVIQCAEVLRGETICLAAQMSGFVMDLCQTCTLGLIRLAAAAAQELQHALEHGPDGIVRIEEEDPS